MHPRKSWLVIGILAAFTVQAGAIYKWTDKDGVVHYSDQESPGAEKISISSINSSKAPNAPNTPAANFNKPIALGPLKQKAGALNYEQFSITAPSGDQTFFADDVVAVHLDLAPALKPNQAITWHLNGKQLDNPPDTTSFALPQLERGTYALAATITDQLTGESQTSNSVNFFVRQPTVQGPQHK
jgi:hypothetical protein